MTSKAIRAAITTLIWAAILHTAFRCSGCTNRYAQVTKPDGTEIIVELSEVMSDKEIGSIEITVDKVTGAYTFTVNGYNSETSPIVSSLIKAVYEAGVKAGGI